MADEKLPHQRRHWVDAVVRGIGRHIAAGRVSRVAHGTEAAPDVPDSGIASLSESVSLCSIIKCPRQIVAVVERSHSRRSVFWRL